jgi:DnaJ-class molecular chaperone
LNHYQILGLEKNCSHHEIKTAFRALAKIYHPDKNESGKEFFEKLLIAYETLSNERKRKHYDLKLEYLAEQANGSKTTATSSLKKTKEWKFDDKELKRRQYYNEFIKQKNKQTQHVKEEEIHKTNYNEFKYFVFADYKIGTK